MLAGPDVNLFAMFPERSASYQWLNDLYRELRTRLEADAASAAEQQPE
jgi:hypothetical protein